MIRISNILKKADKKRDSIDKEKESFSQHGNGENSNNTLPGKTSHYAETPSEEEQKAMKGKLINPKNQDRNMMGNLLEQYEKKSWKS